MIDPKQVAHMAHLARLKVSDTQLQEYSKQLQNILKYFEQISKVNTQGVEPMITPTEIEEYWREDQSQKESTSEQMLANAPERAGNLFKVPPVV